MIFKDIKIGYPVYFLQKDGELKAYQGKVIAVSQPRFPQIQTTPTMQQTATSMVIDVTIETNGETKTYTIPETSSVVNAGMLVLSVDRDGVLREVEAVKSQSEEALRNIEKHKETVITCERILEDWNPAFAEKKAQDARISSIETEVKGLGAMLKDFISEFKK